jgi:hypothetical protein
MQVLTLIGFGMDNQINRRQKMVEPFSFAVPTMRFSTFHV